MKFFNIDAFFKKAAHFQLRYRILILVSALILGLVSLAGLFKIRLTTDIETLPPSEEQLQAEKRFYELFPQDSLFVLVTADDVFDSRVLETIKTLGNRLEKEVPTAGSAFSLLTMPVPIGSEDGIEISNPFAGGIPSDEQALSDIKKFFLNRQSIVNTFLSEDSKETWIILPLGDIENDLFRIIHIAQDIIRQEGENSSGLCRLYPIGWQLAFVESSEYAIHEAFVRVSIGFVVMLFMLILLVRSVRGVVFSLLAAFFGIFSVFGISCYMNIPVNTSAMSLPMLLGMALSIGYSLHVINSFKRHFRHTGKRKDSVVLMMEECGWSILFTVITTAAALISFMFFDMKILHWIGGISSGVVFAVYLYVVILIPIMLSFGKDKEACEDTEAKGATRTDLFFEKIGKSVLGKSGLITAISAIIIAVLIPGIMRISINMDLFEMQGPKVPHIARTKEMLSFSLGSLYSYDIMISHEDDIDAFKRTENLVKLDQLDSYLGELRLTKKSSGKGRVLSACDMLKEINRMFNGDKEEFFTIASEDDVSAQMLMFYADNFASYFDIDNDDFGTTRLHVELTGFDSKKLLSDVDEAVKRARSLFPESEVFAIGRTIDFARTNESMVTMELQSLLVSFIIIALLLITAFSSVKTGLIAMIPNVAPVLTLAGIMGYTGQPLDILTVTVMPMVLGLAVDDTIHLTNHIKREFIKSSSYKEATLRSFREIAKTMCMTSVILCAMFAVYLFSPMRFFVHTGILSIIGISSALIADYTLTPAVLYLIKPFGKEKAENSKEDL